MSIALVWLSLDGAPAAAQTSVYWDTNGTATGAGNTSTPAGNWSVTGNAFWTTNSAGTSTTVAWGNVAGNKTAVFAAGNNATGTYTVTTTANITGLAGITFEDGNVTIGGTGGLTLAQNAAINTVDAAGVQTISTVIGGTFGLTKTGNGTLVLSGTNTFTGTTTISQGTLQLNANAPSGAAGTFGNATSNVLLGDGSANTTALLAGVNNAAINRNITVSSGGASTIGGASSLTSGAASFGGNITLNKAISLEADGTTNVTFSGIISGTGNVTKIGTGTVTLNNASNSYVGNTIVGSAGGANAGTLTIGTAGALGNGSLIIYGGNVSLNGTDTVNGLSLGGGAVGSTAILSGGSTLTLNGNVSYDGSTGANGASISAAVALGSSNRTFNVSHSANATDDLTVSTSVNGNGGVIKTGNGTLVLSGSNGYTGTTVVNGGTLSVATLSGSSAITVDGGTLKFTNSSAITNSNVLTVGTTGTIDASGASTVGFTSGGTIGFSGTGPRTLTLTGTSTGNNQLNNVIADSGTGATSVVKNGAGTWLFNSGASNTYSGTTTVNAGTLLLSQKSGRNATGTGDIIIGDGTSAATLKYFDTANQLANSADIFLNNNGTFDMNGFSDSMGIISDGSLVSGGYGRVLLGGATLTVGASNSSGTFSGVISGTGSVVSTGTGMWTLAGNNTFQGGLTLNTGSLGINNAGALGTGTFTIKAGTTIDNTSGSAIVNANNNALAIQGSFTFAGSNDLNLGSGNVTMGSATTITTNGSELTIGGRISGAGSLVKAGAGALTLSGNNAYSGATTLSGGTLNTNNASALGTGALTINAGTTIDNTSGGAITLSGITSQTWNGDFSFGGTNSLDLGTGAVALGGNVTITTDTAAGGTGTLSIGGAISGTSRGITTAGTGTVVLYGNNTYSGTTNITAGTLQVGNGGSTGTLGAASTINISNAATLVTNRSGTLTIGDTISGAGGIVVSNVSGGTTVLSGTNNFTGGTTVNSGTLKLSNLAGMGNAGAAVNLNGGTLDLATDTSVNAYNVTVSASSTILSDKATAASAGITHNLGTLSIGSQTLTAGVGGNVASGNAGVSFGATTLTGNATFATASAGTVGAVLTLGALNDGGSATALTFSGNGTTALGTAATSLVNGTTANVTGGTLALNSAGALGTLANVTVASGATVSLGANETLGGLNGAGAVALSTNTLTVGSSNDLNSTFSGGLSGSGSLVKAGNGTLTVSGANSYTGGTTVNTGTLVAANASALGGATSVTTVANGASLGLSGGITLAAGNIGITGAGVGGAGALYNASGSNSYTGNVVINADATISATTGTLTLGGTTSGNITLSNTAAANATVTFNAGSGAIIDVKGSITDKASTKALNVAMTGNGTLKFDNTDFYFGNLTIGTAGGSSNGTLQLNSATALPTRNNSSLITVYAGTLDLNGFNNTAQGSLSLGGGATGSSATVQTGAGTLTLIHDVTYDATNNANGATISGNLALRLGSHKFTINDSMNAANDLTVSAAIGDSLGAGEIDKYGNGTLLLTGNSSYTGLTNILAGVISVQNNNALGSTAGNTTVSAGAGLQLSNAANGNLNVAETLLLAGSGYNGNGALQNVAGNNTWSGLIALNNYDSRIQSDSGTLTIAGNVAVIGTVPGNAGSAMLTIGGAGDTKITGSLLSGTVGNITSVEKYDAGTLTLTNSNTIGGGAINVHGGTLSVQNNYALGSTATTTTVDSGATIAFDSTANGNLSTGIGLNTLNVSGTGVGNAGVIRNTAGTNTFNSAVNLNAASLITANAGTALTLAGNVTATSSSNALTVGTTAQNGNVTVSGYLNLNGATLNKNGTMGASNGVLTLSGGGSTGTVNLNEGRISVTASTVNTGAFTAAANTSLLIASGGTVNVTGNATFNSHTLDGSGGTLKVNGNNSLTFNGTINAPNMTLILNGGSIGSNAAPLTVYLGGANVTVGAIQITGDTILDFGNSAGTVLSSLTLDIVGNAKVQVNNWKTTNGNTSLSTIWYATSTVNNQTLTTSPPTNQYPSTNTDLGQITFNNPQGSIGSTVTWVEDTSQGWFDHEIRPTPEPSTYGVILISSCLGVLGFRRYRRNKTAQTAA